MEWIVISADTVSHAQARALDELAIDIEDAEMEVLAEPKRSLVGLRSQPARIRMRVRPKGPPPRIDDRRRSSSRRRPKNASKSGQNRSRQNRSQKTRSRQNQSQQGQAQQSQGPNDNQNRNQNRSQNRRRKPSNPRRSP